MGQKWIQFLVIVVFYQNIATGAGAGPTTEGSPVDISCKIDPSGNMIVWFRVLDASGMQFIGSFNKLGEEKAFPDSSKSIFSASKMKENILTLNSFSKTRDSGVYSCASFVKGNELSFGPATRLTGIQEEPKKPAPVAITTSKPLCTTAPACDCPRIKTTSEETRLPIPCDPIILGSLAGGCGLLLLLLIVAILYCNKIRTRRCPHHYKRRPRGASPGKLMTNSHI